MFDGRQQTGTMFKNCHPAPQTVVHLAQFNGDHPPADNDERGRKLLEQQGAAAGVVGTFFQSRQIGDARIAAHGDEKTFGAEAAVVALDGAGIAETGGSLDQFQPLHAAENIEIALLAQPAYNRFSVPEEPFRVNSMVVISLLRPILFPR